MCGKVGSLWKHTDKPLLAITDVQVLQCVLLNLLQVDQENERPLDSSSPLTTASPLHKLGSFKNAPKSGGFSVRLLSARHISTLDLVVCWNWMLFMCWLWMFWFIAALCLLLTVTLVAGCEVSLLGNYDFLVIFTVTHCQFLLHIVSSSSSSTRTDYSR